MTLWWKQNVLSILFLVNFNFLSQNRVQFESSFQLPVVFGTITTLVYFLPKTNDDLGSHTQSLLFLLCVYEKCWWWSHNNRFPLSIPLLSSILFIAWLLPLYEQQWRTMLSVYSGADRGPAEVDEDDFHKYSFRCGRMLESDSRVKHILPFFLIVISYK